MSARGACEDHMEVDNPIDEDESRAIREYERGSNPYWHPEKVDVLGKGDFFISSRTRSAVVMESPYHPHVRLVLDLVEEGVILIDEVGGTESRFRNVDELRDVIAKGEIVIG